MLLFPVDRSSLRFLASSSAIALAILAVPAMAQTRNFDVPAQSAEKSIPLFAKQAGVQLVASGVTVRGKKTNAVRGSYTVDAALQALLKGTGLTTKEGPEGSNFITIVTKGPETSSLDLTVRATQASAPATQYDEIIVTAQKKEERITDVPIAMSAFSAEALDDYKIEGGSELLRAVPNVTFSKSNFASYNFSIRGIGTKALSVSSDPAVAISFNNTPLIRNRLFEQEYFDVERVEVLRGPQGTLYGRNATGGVVNMITKKPEFSDFDGSVRLETGNFNTRRISGMMNIPLDSQLSLRFAGALTKRDGFDFNTFTKNKVNGRDLWSTRLSLGWEPSERLSISAIWEHFSEDDDRSRTGKQLCHRDPGPAMVGAIDISNLVSTRGALSQGCLPGSIYDDAAYGVPNGLSMAHIIGASSSVLGWTTDNLATRQRVYVLDGSKDPYEGVVQSRNLREINTQLDPVFRAKNDVFQVNLDISISNFLKFISQTAYTVDNYYSTQDYYRFVSNDVWNDSFGLYNNLRQPNAWTEGLMPDGEVNDPQLGRSRKLLGMDMVRSKSNQIYQEFRLQSSFEGKFNFNIGFNYTKFKINEDYFVFNNLFTVLSHGIFSTKGIGGNLVNCETQSVNFLNCAYVDMNTVDRIDGNGHNYFRSINVSKTKSLGYFGEVYYNLNEDLKLASGIRYTDDKKVASPYKTQLLLAPGIIGAGEIGKGFVADPNIVQNWGRFTGRVVLDWKPTVEFADDFLIYGSYSRGYKGGGANPPPIGANRDLLVVFDNPLTFGPEAVNAYEVGVKGSFFDRKFAINAAGFYYDYSGYQVSQIVDRIALNENFDAKMWGVDLEMLYRPTPRIKLNVNAGYLRTRIADGEESIDVMNRTQGSSEYMVVKPWLQLSTNCIVPTSVIAKIVSHPTVSDTEKAQNMNLLCGGNYLGDFKPNSLLALKYGVSFDVADSPNGGRGFMAPLGGNELPNSPRWTMGLGGQYSIPISDWEARLRFDYYMQGKSWARVYNSKMDRLKSWDNLNLSFYMDHNDSKLSFQFYVKNVLNKSSITDMFINSDDSALTTNVFTVDPRIIGFSVGILF